MECHFVVKNNNVLILASMEQLWKHAKSKKPFTEGHILYDSTIWNVWNQQMYRGRKWLPRALEEVRIRGDC